MYMAYTNNPNLPRVRMAAVEMVQQGKSVRETSRHFGFAHNTILNWLKKSPEYGGIWKIWSTGYSDLFLKTGLSSQRTVQRRCFSYSGPAQRTSTMRRDHSSPVGARRNQGQCFIGQKSVPSPWNQSILEVEEMASISTSANTGKTRVSR